MSKKIKILWSAKKNVYRFLVWLKITMETFSLCDFLY